MEESRQGYRSLAVVNGLICLVSVIGWIVGQPDWWPVVAGVAVVSATVAAVSAIRLAKMR